MKLFLSVALMLTFCLIFPISTVAVNTCQNQEKKKQEKQEKVKSILVSGIIKDEQGNRLKNVIIMVVRESETDVFFGVESGQDGKYSIRVKSDSKLNFTLNGYESQIISISGRDEIDIVMKKKINSY